MGLKSGFGNTVICPACKDLHMYINIYIYTHRSIKDMCVYIYTHALLCFEYLFTYVYMYIVFTHIYIFTHHLPTRQLKSRAFPSQGRELLAALQATAWAAQRSALLRGDGPLVGCRGTQDPAFVLLRTYNTHMCKSASIYIYMYIYIYIYYVYIYILYVYVCACVAIYSVYMSVYIYIYVSVFRARNTYMHMYIYIHRCLHRVWYYVYIHTHAYEVPSAQSVDGTAIPRMDVDIEL